MFQSQALKGSSSRLALRHSQSLSALQAIGVVVNTQQRSRRSGFDAVCNALR